MFLPDYVEYGFDNATITQNGLDVPLVKEKIITYESRDEEPPKGPPHPLYVFATLAFLALVITIWDFARRKLSMWFDVLLFSAAGLTGLLLCFLWFFTDHRAAAKNFNLLWALPTHLIAVTAFFNQAKWLKGYFFLIAIITGATLVAWPILPQTLHYALIPLVATLGIRAFVQFYLRKGYRKKSPFD
jgi:hypothetical protein